MQEFHVALTTAEMTRLMHSCDLLIGPNHAVEGFGLPAAEAMASGIPLVSTRVGQAQDLVEHGRNGWLVEPDDPEGLAGWVTRVRDGVGSGVLEAGRETAEQFAYERLDERWRELLDGFVEPIGR